mmetsp:Transcript_27946/g.42242  ORF Transcript_27946/g.42242 Transcript_27946/m.42242 type:complete len:487 (+) Transcript_27946:260-1720(+)
MDINDVYTDRKNKDSPNFNPKRSSIMLDEETVKNHIDEVVKRQLSSQFNFNATTPQPFTGKGSKKKIMGSTSGHQRFLNDPSMDDESADNAPHRLSVRGDDMKSQRSFKTQMTAKSKFLNGGGVKFVTGGSLAPVGIMKKETQKDTSRSSIMLKQTLGTETLVDKIIEMVEGKEDLQEWPIDAHENPNLRESLSYTKMINEVNHREPREIDSSGTISQLQVCGSSTGCMTTKKDWRKGDTEQLGLGINLYLKTLKYFSCLFFFFFLLSLPSLFIYNMGGTAYDDHRIGVQRLIASTTTGNLGSPSEIVASAAVVPNTRNMAAYVPIDCKDKFKTMSDIVHFGLAYKDYTSVGFGLNVTVRTIDRCSYGMMKDQRTDGFLEEAFNADCLGKQRCNLFLDFDKVFDSDCQYEMSRRLAGKTFYGPPKVYLLTMCSRDSIEVTENWDLPWDRASMVVVWIDILIVFCFILAIFRLKFYSDMVIMDHKDG